MGMTRLSPQQAADVAIEHAKGTVSALEMMMLRGPLKTIIGQLYAADAVGTGRYSAAECSSIIVNQAVANGHNSGMVRAKVEAVVNSIYKAGYYAAVGIETGFYFAKGD